MHSSQSQSNLGSTPLMSRVDWAIARYNWYRACGRLDDSSRRTAKFGTQHCPIDPPPPRPHLKWYPLSKLDDDVATTYRPPIGTAPQQCYSRQASINADAGTSPLRHQTTSTAGHAANGLSHDPRTWSRVDWAIARYNWYRACGLLDDSPQQPTVITRYRRSPDPPRPKPHLKWYPLNKPDDEVATPYQRSGTATPSAPPRKRYDQRVEHAHVRTILARYQAEKEEATKGPISDHHFDPSKHPRDRIGRFTEKGEGVTTSVEETSPASKQNGLTQGEELAPKTVAFQTSDGKPFYVSTDDKWRHKPSAGLHVPGLATEDVETFLDLVEQASALSDAMSENYRQLREVRNEVQSRGWTLWPSPDHLRSLKTKQAQYERDRAALQFKWDELEAEYHKAGFRDLQVTGFRVGTNSEYQQDWDRGKGLTNVVQAYRKSQEEDLRGGRGLEATYDEMAIITAPADLVGAFRLGSALIRTGYHVVKQGASFAVTRRLLRLDAHRHLLFSSLQQSQKGLLGSAFPQNLRAYLQIIEAHTGFKLHSKQRALLTENLRSKRYVRLSTEAGKKHRRKFRPEVRRAQIAEWERQTGQKWPRYTEVVFDAKGKISREAGAAYDAHHVIENIYGGPHEWWNLTPARFPDEHQGGVHLEQVLDVLFP